MLLIAICDDQPDQLLQIRQMMDAYVTGNGIAARIREFSSGLDLLNAVEETGPFDLYILDIVMPQINGIDLGLALRKTDREGTILYLTTSPDFALASYQARAFFYLLKPVEPEQLFSILDEAIQLQNKRQKNGIQVKTKEGPIRLLFDNILYAELKNRQVRYALRDGSLVDSVTFSGSFRDAVSPLLKERRFMLCGSSFLVHLHHVRMVDKTGATFSDGHLPPPPPVLLFSGFRRRLV